MTLLKTKVGDRFGKLVVIEQLTIGKHGPKNHSKSTFLCKCDCGNTRVFTSTGVRFYSRSCGCLTGGRLADGEAALNALFGIYKRLCAKKRKLEWNISLEQFRNITKQVCRYCGAEPSNRHERISGDYIYNGLDRIDNTKGYILENVVPCCRVCNRAKDIMSEEEFLKWIQKVYSTSIKGD